MPHSMKLRFPLVLFAIAAAVHMGACSPSSAGKNASGMNLLVITLDTTRADVVGLYGGRGDITPNIDGLGRGGVVFRDCVTPVPLTLPSHCSIFTGRYPIAHLVRNNGTYVLPERETTLAEMFKGKGYATSAVIASFTVASKFGLKQGFDDYDEDLESGSTFQTFNTEIPADRVYEKFVKWLDGRPDRAFFSWLHFYDPHSPYAGHGPSGPGTSNRDLYLGEVGYVDRYVGRVVEALKARGLYENTVIVIMGDHGEGFGEHGEYGHGIFCYGETLLVPLIMHNPKLFPAGRVVEDRVCLIDVMPTILDVFGLKAPEGLQGGSLMKLVRGGGRRSSGPLYFESLFGKEENNWAPITGFMEGRYKYISLLYDLEKDAREAANLAGGMTDETREMDRKLRDIVAAGGSTKAAERRALSDADLQKLTALGYVSAFSAKAGKMIDPKTAIAVYAEAAEMEAAMAKGDFDGTAKKFAALRSRQPDLQLPELYSVEYGLLMLKGDRAGAFEVLKKANAAFPAKDSFKFHIVDDLIAGGKLDAAEEWCRRFLDEDERMTTLRILLGDIEMKRGRYAAAVENYGKAAALEPGNGMLGIKRAQALAAGGDLSGAETALQGAGKGPGTAGSEEYAGAASDLGLKLFFSGQKDRGLAWLEKACAAAPGSAAGRIDLGVAYFNDRKYDLALENYQKALEIDRNSAAAHCNIGMLYLARFMEESVPALLDKAQEHLDRAVELAPGLAAAYTGRGSVNMAWGELKKALRDYAQAIKLDPDQGDAYINSALALQLMGRYGEALEVLDRFKARLYDRVPPAQRTETDKLYEQLKAMKDRG